MAGVKVENQPRNNFEKIPNGRFDNVNEILKRKLEREARQEQTRRKLNR